MSDEVIDADVINVTDSTIHPPRQYTEQSLIGTQQRRIRDLEKSIEIHKLKIKDRQKEIKICKDKIRLYEKAESLSTRK